MPEPTLLRLRDYAREITRQTGRFEADRVLLAGILLELVALRDDLTAPAEEEEPTRVDQRPNGCWAACVATITGIPLEELDQGIPVDADPAWFDANATRLHNDMVLRLRERGWRLQDVWRDVPRGFAIANGYTSHEQRVQHAVVVKDGALWHDPHPSRAGLLTVEGYEVLIPIMGSLPAQER